jgi:hypothetical protein
LHRGLDVFRAAARLPKQLTKDVLERLTAAERVATHAVAPQVEFESNSSHFSVKPLVSFSSKIEFHRFSPG